MPGEGIEAKLSVNNIQGKLVTVRMVIMAPGTFTDARLAELTIVSVWHTQLDADVCSRVHLMFSVLLFNADLLLLPVTDKFGGSALLTMAPRCLLVMHSFLSRVSCRDRSLNNLTCMHVLRSSLLDPLLSAALHILCVDWAHSTAY